MEGRAAEPEAPSASRLDAFREQADRFLTQLNEDDRSVRERLAGLRGELLDEHLNPIYAEALGVAHRAASALGASSYVDLHRRFGFQLDRLADQCRTALEETEDVYERAADRLFRTRVG